jgi:hypothetical protein
MTTYVFRNGRVVEKARSKAMSAGFYVMSDNLGGMLLHPVTGKRTDSKSSFRQMTRDTGSIEVGTERFAPQRVQKRGESAQVTLKRLLGE